MSILANGVIPVTKATIYEVDPIFLSKSSVDKVTIFNDNVVAQTVVLFLKIRNGVSRKIRQFILQQNEGGEYLEPGESLSLDVGDVIEAQTTTASAVDFTILGTET